ncbi:armadillo-type protein [Mycena floridula]|nr:armadillo-type protein [Mycena floridula]
MDLHIDPQITAELTQILSNLVLGDNTIRASAEKAVDERLLHTPDLYILALCQFAVGAEKEVMRSFSLVLLRRLLFRPRPQLTSSTTPGTALSLYDHLSIQTLTTLEKLLLHSLMHERAYGVRIKSVDTTCDVANQAMRRGRPWHDLQAQVFGMSQSEENWELRESAFKVFTGSPNLVTDLQTEAVVNLLARGLGDTKVEVRLAALDAAVAYLMAADPAQIAASGPQLMIPILETLPALASSNNSSSMATPSATSPPSSALSSAGFPTTPPASVNLTLTLSSFLSALTPLASTHPSLFAPHLSALLSFLPGLVLPIVDAGVTPTVARPAGDSVGRPRQGSFHFPPLSPVSGPPQNSGRGGLNLNTNFPAQPFFPGRGQEDGDGEEQSTLRLTALEFMLSLSEARPSMVKRVDGWVSVVVRACLEGMSEIDDGNESEETALKEWLDEDPSTQTSSSDDSNSALYEQSLDRFACALGGKAVLPSTFQYIPSMLASYDWRTRHAGLMSIACIAEGTGKIMQNELGKVVDLVLPLFKDSHPRVRYAACQCVGQLCTDLEEIIQQQYHQQLFSVLIPTLEDPVPRVHSHAASALINFCEGVERDTLLPYLDPIVERLLHLLNPEGTSGDGQKPVKRYVQEQAITTLAMVADASEASFAKFYSTIMPLLLNVLRNADGTEYRRLRIKAMESIAVGRETFRPDANTFAESLIRLQKTPPDPEDTQLSHYLIATWAKVCQAMGPEFEPYLPFVMPALLTSASAKADVAVYDKFDEIPTDEESEESEREGWETINMDGQVVGVRTSGIEEKCQAFETMVIYASTLGPKFAPYLSQSLEITLPQLRFHFHDGVREACAMLIPMLLAAGKSSGTLTNEMVSATFLQLINCISEEHDASFLASIFKSFTDSLLVIGGPSSLSREYHDGIIEATKRQLQVIADRRRARANRPAVDLQEDRDDMALLEEMEDFSLEEMAKMLKVLDPNASALLVAISSVKDLGFNQYDSDDDEQG